MEKIKKVEMEKNFHYLIIEQASKVFAIEHLPYFNF